MDLTRPRRRTLFLWDCALAVLMALFSVVLLWLSYPDRDPGVATTAVMAAQALALCLRRVSPVPGLLVMLALQVALCAVAMDGVGLRGPALTIAVYTCGTLMTARRALALAGLTALVEVTAYATLGGMPLRGTPLELSQLAGQALLALLLYAGGALLGQNTAMRRRYAEVVEQRAAADAEAHRARTEAALSAERARMARELHDVAAHHLTSLIVQATLAERLLDRDVEAARRATVAVREEGRSTLHQLRLIVGALRADGGTDPHLPDGGLAMIERLTADGTASLTVTGTPTAPAPAVDLTFYRVAQEALANARQHAPGAAVAVTLAYRPAETTMDIHNTPAPGGTPAADRRHPGFGLVGMRERATLIGATLTAGPAPDGGWRVTLTVPRTAAEKEPT
ncbi:sensor histidine kinase [Catenuloplanes atrovinosus]|uniref:histidine kinase n=1 Tax=Catenuloplanes atrovinosus TaxID=137266 RepID=A0AAE3YMC6_9ACTN|nr:histidine kinase [Catenuloplanes atrovinosus]MDR7274833.1 signal transduction histidine kinase [Catenuloplanes atrovinosus]